MTGAYSVMAKQNATWTHTKMGHPHDEAKQGIVPAALGFVLHSNWSTDCLTKKLLRTKITPFSVSVRVHSSMTTEM